MNRERVLFASRITVAASWLLVTLNISQNQGLFVHPLLFHLTVRGTRYPIGAILLVPAVAAVTTATAVWLGRGRPYAGLRFGRPGMTLAVLSLGLLALVRSWPIHRFAVLIPSVVAVMLFWGVYAYTLHAGSPAWFAGTLSVFAMLHGTVSVAQFVRQGSVGLSFLGELALDPQVRGISVIEVAGQRWLRAYGLLPHPNVLGGVLGIALLVCLGMLLQPGGACCSSGSRRWLWAAVMASGGGLVISFSRSAWLGTGAGLLYLIATTRLWRRVTPVWLHVTQAWRRVDWRSRRTRGLIAATAIMAAAAILAAQLVVLPVTGTPFGRLMIARLGRTASPLEQASLSERTRDMAQAWMLIRHLPLTGVGTGYYVDALWAWAGATGREFPAFQDVHNVPLLIGAEMGLPATGMWLWLVSLPIIQVARAARKQPAHPFRAALGAAFVVLWIAGMLDAYPYPLHFRSAALLGALCGMWAQTPGKEAVKEIAKETVNEP